MLTSLNLNQLGEKKNTYIIHKYISLLLKFSDKKTNLRVHPFKLSTSSRG